MIGTLNKANISHKKILLAAKLIRNKKVQKAQEILQLIPKKSCKILLKLLKSVISNAQQKKAKEQEQFDISKYVVNLVEVGRAQYLKRFQPRAKGAAYPIKKHYSNVTILLKEEGKEENGK